MEYNMEKVYEVVLALLYLTAFKNKSVFGAWKGIDWDSMEQLHKKGYIGDPKSKSKSVLLSKQGVKIRWKPIIFKRR